MAYFDAKEVARRLPNNPAPEWVEVHHEGFAIKEVEINHKDEECDAHVFLL